MKRNLWGGSIVITVISLFLTVPARPVAAQGILEDPFSILFTPEFRAGLEAFAVQIAAGQEQPQATSQPTPRESIKLAVANRPGKLLAKRLPVVRRIVRDARDGNLPLTEDQLAVLRMEEQQSLGQRIRRVLLLGLIDGFLNLEQVAAPTFRPADGTEFDSVLSVTLSSSTADAEIHFTTDGSTPTPQSTLYIGPIRLQETTTIKARAFAPGLIDSSVTEATFSLVQREQVAAPVFDPPDGTPFTGSLVITIASATPSASIRFTTNGTNPSSTSEEFTGSITITETTTIKARAFKTGLVNSVIVTATFTQQP